MRSVETAAGPQNSELPFHVTSFDLSPYSLFKMMVVG